MKRYDAFVFSLMAVVTTGCAGSLEDPSRFEQGSTNTDEGTATGDGEEATDGDAADDEGGDGSSAGDGTPAGDGDGEPVSEEPADCDFAALMETKCGGCHGATAPFANLDLVSPGLADRVVDESASSSCGSGALVDTSAPDQSVLYLKVVGTDCGGRMPTGGELSADEQACVLSWIQGL